MLQAIPRAYLRIGLPTVLLVLLIYVFSTHPTLLSVSSTITNASAKYVPSAAQVPKTSNHPLAPSFPGSTYPLIPRKVWQTAPANDPDTSFIPHNSWHELNPSWRYELLSDEMAETFINESFATTRPEIFNMYHRIETPIIKVDLLRYLALLHNGGLYADIDVECIEPIDSWLPAPLREQAGMILGIEYDDTKERSSSFPDLFLAQYIMVSRPNHPVMEAVVRETLAQLEALDDRDPAHAASPRPNVISAADAHQVLTATGPWMFQKAVFGTLAQISEFRDASELHHLHEPRLYGDVLILPINGFGSGQDHSRSGEAGMGQRLVQHKFRQSWIDHETWKLSFEWKGNQGKAQPQR